MARRRRSKKKSSSLQRLYFGKSARSHRRSRRRQRGFMSGGGSSRYSLSGLTKSPVGTLKPAVVGAAGALAVTAIMGKLVPMLPGAATLLGGRMRYVTQIVAALGLAQFGGKFIGAGTASKMAEGALIVTMVDVLRDVSGQLGIPLSGMGYYLPGYGVTGATAPVPGPAARPARVAGMNSMGKYLTGPGASVVPFRRQMAGMPYGSASFSKGF